MKRYRPIGIGAVVLFLLVAARWVLPGSTPTVSDEWLTVDGAPLRIDQFTAVSARTYDNYMRQPSAVAQWLRARFPRLIHIDWPRRIDRPEEGFVTYVIRLSVDAPPNPYLGEKFDFYLDYGAYTYGNHGWGYTARAGEPLLFATTIVVPEGPLPQALIITAGDESHRLPITYR